MSDALVQSIERSRCKAAYEQAFLNSVSSFFELARHLPQPFWMRYVVANEP